MEMIIVNQPRVFPHQTTYLVIKRVMDIVFCILLLPFALPLMILCALAIHLDEPDGPVFFVQERIGRGGQPFRMIKFRTMKANTENSQSRAFMKAYVRGEIGNDNEGRQSYKPIPSEKIFRVGRFLRKTSIDELPQIINVLKGEMSIIGPRPNVPWEVEAYRSWHHERLEVLPGITGLAQVRGRSNSGFNSLVRYDIAYIEQQGLELDLLILWWTFLTIVRAKGAI